MEQQTGSKLGKEWVKAIYCHPALFNLYSEYIVQNAQVGESQAEIKTARRNIINLRYADDTILMAESKEELKSLDEGERGEWKSWLKAQHSENKDHGIRSITSWQIDGEPVGDFIFLGSKITAEGGCSHKIKRLLLLGRKGMTNLKHIKKQRHHFTDKGLSSQSYGFSSSHIRMWELDHKERWALKNWCFRTVVLEKTLEESLGLQGDKTS